MNTANATKLKRRLWLENPLCYWCGRFTFLLSYLGGRHIPLQATLDHLYHRKDPRRLTDRTRVLSCYECNQKRGIQDNKDWDYLYWLIS